VSTYDRPLVEQLLPAVWDSSYAYGMNDPTAPDPDMPRAAADKAHSNTLYAHLADIKAGWVKAPIPRPERQALFLRYGLDLRQSDIGKRQGVTQKAVSERLARGVGRIVATLNGQTADDTEATTG
jgi:DNA-directed RNA polymerase specialized sigma24 family protein